MSPEDKYAAKMADVIKLMGRPGYNKDAFHPKAKAALKLLAGLVGTTDFDVRSNRGGDGVGGEVTLHTDRLYVQFGPDSLDVMYRTVRGRKDYSGGGNQWTTARQLVDPCFVERLRRMQSASQLVAA